MAGRIEFKTGIPSVVWLFKTAAGRQDKPYNHGTDNANVGT